MVTTSPVFTGRLDDFLVLGELPPGNDQAAMSRWEPARNVVAVTWDEELQSGRRQDEQGIWSALSGWDL